MLRWTPRERSNAPCILFAAIVNLQCSHPVLHSKTSINTSRPIFSVYMRFKPLPGKKCLQSVFAICNCNRTILARTPPWGECLQSVFAICNSNRTILARTPLWGEVPAECICNLQLQPDDLGSNLSLGRMPAECICNLQLQSDDLGSNPSLGRSACRVYLQSAIAAGRSWLEPLPGENACRVYLQSAIAIGRSWLEPLSGEKCLQSVFAICNCNRTILARTPPFTSLGRNACRVYLQSAIATEHLLAIGQPSICNCSRTSAIAAEHLQLQPSICNCSRGCICNCSRAFAIAVQLQPSICNCSRASAIVTENAHAHVQFELRQRRASQLYPVKFRVKFITNIDAVGGWMPTASRSVGTFFLLIYSGIAAASRRGCPASGGPRHANHHVPNASGGGVCAPSVPCSGSALLATRAGQSHAATPRSAQRAKKDLDLSGALPNISRASAVAASLQRCN
jgi:hypothetical protein